MKELGTGDKFEDESIQLFEQIHYTHSVQGITFLPSRMQCASAQRCCWHSCEGDIMIAIMPAVSKKGFTRTYFVQARCFEKRTFDPERAVSCAHIPAKVCQCAMFLSAFQFRVQGFLLLVSRHMPMGENPRVHAAHVWECCCPCCQSTRKCREDHKRYKASRIKEDIC